MSVFGSGGVFFFLFVIMISLVYFVMDRLSNVRRIRTHKLEFVPVFAAESEQEIRPLPERLRGAQSAGPSGGGEGEVGAVCSLFSSISRQGTSQSEHIEREP